MSHQDPVEQRDTIQTDVPIIVLPPDQSESGELQHDFSAFADHPDLSDLSVTVSIGYQVDWTGISDHGSHQELISEDYAYSEFPASPAPASPSLAPVSPHISSAHLDFSNAGRSQTGSPYTGSPFLDPYPSGDSEASHSTTGSISGGIIDLTLDADQDNIQGARSDVEASSAACHSEDARSKSTASKKNKTQRDIEEWFSVADNATRFKAELERLRGWWGDQYKKLSEEMSIPGSDSQLKKYVYAHRADFGLKPKVKTAGGIRNQKKFERMIFEGESRKIIEAEFASQKHALSKRGLRAFGTESPADLKKAHYKQWLTKVSHPLPVDQADRKRLIVVGHTSLQCSGESDRRYGLPWDG